MSSTPPTASVIIVTYNSASTIHMCLDALGAQDFQAPFEIIIVDNDSTDETRRIVSTTYPQVKLIHSQNRGFGAGNNVGARAAHGRLLAFINPDTRPATSWLRNLLGPLTQPGIVTTSRILILNGGGIVNTCGNVAHFTGLALTRGLGRPASEYAQIQELHAISGAAFGICATDFEAVGGFDEDYFLYVEDTDISWRLQRKGVRILLAPDSVVEHAYEFKVTAQRLYHVQRGRLLLLRKHLTLGQWARFLPSLALVELMLWALATRQGTKGMWSMGRATMDGWRARLSSRPPLPPFKPQAATDRTIPFESFTSKRVPLLLGRMVNAMFRLNTLGWRGGDTA